MLTRKLSAVLLSFAMAFLALQLSAEGQTEHPAAASGELGGTVMIFHAGSLADTRTLKLRFNKRCGNIQFVRADISPFERI